MPDVSYRFVILCHTLFVPIITNFQKENRAMSKNKTLNKIPPLLCVLCMLLSLLGSKGKVFASEANTSSDLADFLNVVTIDASTDENGNYVINPGSAYDMTLEFCETEETQFDDESILTYTFPNGVQINDVGTTTFSLNVIDENGSAEVHDNTFEVVGNQLRVKFNQNDPNFERLKAMPNVSFSINFSSTFENTGGQIVFNEHVVKDFVYEEISDIDIQKQVVYNKNTDTANYELIIRSEGDNTNVIIEDILRGSALIFNKDVQVSSDKNSTLSITPDYDSIQNGFRLTIPQTENGEVITLKYSATVDNTKISSNGTAEQTNNTARVTTDQVPDGKEVSTDFAGQADFQRVSKNADGDPVKIGENLYEQTWKIIVNEDHKMQMGNANIYDWITSASRPFMHFNNEGITITVTFEDGSNEQRIIPYSDLTTWKKDNDNWGWGYLTPDTDNKASYEITCTTLIDTSASLGNLTLTNGAQIYGSYDDASITFGPIGENNLTIIKNALGTTSQVADWEIKVSVPGDGLPEMHVVDNCPRLAYGDKNYIDNPQEDSFVVEGLMNGESWSLDIDSDRRIFTMTFYRSQTQTDENKGLLPSADGQQRNIVIRYKTKVNQEWLDLSADNGYVSSTLYKHTNYACAWSSSYRTETVDAYVVPIKNKLEKNIAERSEVKIGDVVYPVFRYSLTLNGPTIDGITIQDSFDTEYLKYYEAEGIKILGGTDTNPSNANGAISASNTSSGMDITISSFPKDSNGQFYPYYQITYTLIPKDQIALTALNEKASASQDGIDLTNTAKWDSLEAGSTVNYTYFPYVDKELVTKPTAENGYVAQFKIIINKDAKDLDPTSDVLTIQDVLSENLRFIPESLTITPENDSITATHDSKTNTITFKDVPDNTAFVITYQARVLGNGNVTYSNTVKFGKYEKKIESTTVVSSSGSGSGSNPSITLVKRDMEDFTTTLSGATYQLFYMDNDTMIPVHDNKDQNVTFTTGADGNVLIVGNMQKLGWTLWADRTYCLIEITAPSGYKLNAEPIYFILTSNPSKQIEFDITGDHINAIDERIKISISVTKKWEGPAGSDEVIIRLLANDKDTGMTISLTNQNNWKGSFDNLMKYDDNGKEITYSINEINISGYTSNITGSAEDGFTVTNRKTPSGNEPKPNDNTGNNNPATDNPSNNDNSGNSSTGNDTPVSTGEKPDTNTQSNVILGDSRTKPVDINSQGTPSANTPDTGDHSNMKLYLVTMILSCVGIIILFFIQKNQSRRR